MLPVRVKVCRTVGGSSLPFPNSSYQPAQLFDSSPPPLRSSLPITQATGGSPRHPSGSVQRFGRTAARERISLRRHGGTSLANGDATAPGNRLTGVLTSPR